MSRNLLILLVILALACYGATILYLGPAPPPDNLPKPEANYIEPMGLSVISFGKEISVPNKTALIEKIEQLAEDIYPNWVAIGYIDPIPYQRAGIAATVTYPASIELTWIVGEYINDTWVEKIHPIQVKEITAVIPAKPDSTSRPWVIVYPDQEHDFQFTLQMSVEPAEELRELIGLSPVETKPY